MTDDRTKKEARDRSPIYNCCSCKMLNTLPCVKLTLADIRPVVRSSSTEYRKFPVSLNLLNTHENNFYLCCLPLG